MTNPHPSHIIERMSATTTHTTETTTERKPPTIADIVREKTGDGALIIDFFTDVMTGRIDGAELCHRIDAAKQLVKYGSKDAAEFLAKYKGVPCGHSINGRPNQADPCSAEERSLVSVTLNAPPTLTRDFLTVLSGIDEFLMARLIRAQTAHGDTIIEFLDDVMQDRTDGFKTHHRIAAAKELIVHIIRDEQPAQTPSPSTTPSPLTGEGGARPESPRRACPVLDTESEGDSPSPHPQLIPPLPQAEGWGEGDSTVVPTQAERNPDNSTVIPAKAGIQRSGGPGATRPSKAGAHPEPNSSVVPAHTTVVPAEAGTQGRGVARPSKAGVHPEPSSTVIPAKAGIQGSRGGRSTPANPARTEPALSTAEKPVLSLPKEPVQGSQLETKNSKLKTLPAERRIKEKLEQHWHEPDPWAAPIDSTTPSRSPPR